MPRITDLVGNTQLTHDEFRENIKEKTTPQLRNKIRLGAFLQTRFAKDESEDPRTEATIASLQEQIELLQQELVGRQEELNEIQQGSARKKPPAGPLDQTIGLKSLTLTGKSGMDS